MYIDRVIKQIKSTMSNPDSILDKNKEYNWLEYIEEMEDIVKAAKIPNGHNAHAVVEDTYDAYYYLREEYSFENILCSYEMLYKELGIENYNLSHPHKLIEGIEKHGRMKTLQM